MGMYIAKYQHFSHSVLKAETCNMIVRIANRDLDQTTASEKSDIGLHNFALALAFKQATNV